jgi:choline dehydrogenase
MGKVDQYGKAENPNTVLDSECRVRGVARLRVIDASAMPCITSGNTNAPVMLIAETVARKMLTERALALENKRGAINVFHQECILHK